MVFGEFVQAHEQELRLVSNAARSLSMDAVLAAASGHIGLPLGAADIGTFLYFAAMKHKPQTPRWENRDRFVLSAGHGSALQYSLLHLAGYDVTLDDLRQFRKLGSRTPGHPEFGHTAGIETTTGPLGQGLANAVGIALDERLTNARNSTSSWHTWTIAGDGCLMEGVAMEAASLAGHLKLSRLVVFYDDNKITIDGPTSQSLSEDVAAKFKAMGWNCLQADGHSFASLAAAADKAIAQANDPNAGPTLVVCQTTPGKGSPKWEGKHKVHGNPMTAEDVLDAKKALGISTLDPFAVAEEVRIAAKALLAAAPGASTIATAPQQKCDGKSLLPNSFWDENKKAQATRVASGKALVELAKINCALVGGSADLAGSTQTNLSNTTFVAPNSFGGRNINFGIREHGMGAVANGLAVGGQWRPFVSTFLVFSDYMRAAVRLAALMRIPVIYIFTHDSFHVGEDGPTHQPIEHVNALRTIPNLTVLRPADAWETFAAWEAAVARTDGPTALILTRQDLDALESLGAAPRTPDVVRTTIAEGAAVVKDWHGHASQKIAIAASGSEVGLALQTARILEADGTVEVRVVSVPNAVAFAATPKLLNIYLPEQAQLVSLEAGTTWGARELVGRNGLVIGLSQFGASGKSTDVAKFLGFTPEGVAAKIREAFMKKG